MNKLFTLFVYLSFVFFIIGPVGKIPLDLTGVNIYLLDLVIGLMGIFLMMKFSWLIKLVKKEKIVYSFLFFCLILFLSWLISPIELSLSEKLVSLLYLVRFFAYFFIYLILIYLFDRENFKSESFRKLIIFSGIILASLGWLQYFLYPDLRNLYYLGWDPHHKRIFSTYLDPNFFGLIMVISLIMLLSTNKKSIRYFLIIIFIFITILFTYSRSSFISLLIALIIYLGSKKKYKLLGSILMLFIVLLISLPRNIGGESVKLERMFSLQQRIVNFQEILTIALKNPLFGVGFNTLRYARRSYALTAIDWQENHAAAGADNSFLFIFATSGLVGLTVFIFMTREFFLHVKFAGRVVLITILIHSLFVNSFFYPWVMFLMWIILAIDRKKIS
uniref:O-antigen ligase domain-containing protein n=1 Tax=candidate division CPR3 bacterium TaxID=2268181 RepID=A0A7C4M2J9_UNCC3